MTLVPETIRARARTRVGVHAEDPSYKWWALSCTSLGMLLATINSGTLIIALPDLERSLHTTLLQLVWVILAYMIASTVLVTDAFPRRQLGLAMGTNTMVAAVGLVIGPVLGGALVEISWHWVFWFNIPLGLAGTLWAAAVLHETPRREAVTNLDLLGTALYVAGLTGLVLGVSRGGISGWDGPLTIGSLVT